MLGVTIRGIVPIILVLVTASSGLAQKNDLTEQEFEKIKTAAEKLTFESNRRIVMDSKHFDKGSATEVTLTISEVTESTPGGNWRSLRTEKGAKGTKERETIKVDGVEYFRTEGSKWLKEEKEPNGANRFSAWGEPAGKQQQKFDFAYLGKVQLSGLTVDLYESRKFRSYQLRPDWNYSYTIVERMWIGADGKFVKGQSQTIESDGHLSIDIVWTYAYPAKLSIEAPTG